MANEPYLTCSSCGFEQNPRGTARCISCGSNLDELSSSNGNAKNSRYSQEMIRSPWIIISVLVHSLLTAAVLFGLQAIFSFLDFEGGVGIITCIPLWFFGGITIGAISPKQTILEPVMGAFLVAVPTTYMLMQNQTVHVLPPFLYFVMATIGIFFSLVGAYLGERVKFRRETKAVST